MSEYPRAEDARGAHAVLTVVPTEVIATCVCGEARTGASNDAAIGALVRGHIRCAPTHPAPAGDAMPVLDAQPYIDAMSEMDRWRMNVPPADQRCNAPIAGDVSVKVRRDYPDAIGLTRCILPRHPHGTAGIGSDGRIGTVHTGILVKHPKGDSEFAISMATSNYTWIGYRELGQVNVR